MRRSKHISIFAFLVLAFCATIALAADLDKAKRDGHTGERADGYLGLVVSSVPADVVSMVADVNKKRKVQYQRIAKANSITIEQVRVLAGKKAIERTRSSHWIFVNGGWRRK